MKNYKTIVLIIVLACVSIGKAAAQLPYNSAFNNIIPTIPSVAIVRSLSPSLTAICYYTPSDGVCLIMTNVTTGVPSSVIKLKQMATVSDIRFYNGHLFFCGISHANPANSPHPSSACYGYVDIMSFWVSPPTGYNIEYRYLNLPPKKTKIGPMLVYRNGTADKLVLLGSVDISSGSPSSLIGLIPPPPQHTYVSSSYYGDSRQCFVIECDNPMSVTPTMNLMLVNSDDTHECTCDMTLTDSYVSIVGYDMKDNRIAYVHRCQKSDVLNTFNDRHSYSIPYSLPFSGYRCCSIMHDSIVIANLSDASGLYGIRTRYLNLQTMTMFNAQEIPIPDKTDVLDMVYSPIPKTLLLLSYYDFLGNANIDHVFLRLDPFKTTPYTTTGVVETHLTETYTSMDLMWNNYFVATGGNYEFVKHIVTDSASPCYTTGLQNVKILPTIKINPSGFHYDKVGVIIIPENVPVDHDTINVDTPCR
ncbi:MAG: hypothetical protein J6X88_08240 [Bacteroidales bacterium]|nr:hypothetical protein [Bacteroidales bacterium]